MDTALPRIIDALQTVRTPLVLAGLVVVVMFLLFRTVLRQVARDRGARQTVAARMMTLLFILALSGIVLGFLGFLLPRFTPERPTGIFGKVFEKGDLTRGVGGARVFLEQDDLKTETTDSTGHFVFSLPEERLDRSARLWASADGYVPTDPVQVLLVRGMDALMIPIEPQQTVPGEVLDRARSGKELKRLSAGRIARRFSFEYPLGPYPGRRSWLQAPDGSWLEVYPNGLFAIFRPRGGTTIEGCKGSIVRNLDNHWYEVFVPVPGCEKPWLRFRQYDGAWEYLAVMEEG